MEAAAGGGGAARNQQNAAGPLRCCAGCTLAVRGCLVAAGADCCMCVCADEDDKPLSSKKGADDKAGNPEEEEEEDSDDDKKSGGRRDRRSRERRRRDKDRKRREEKKTEPKPPKGAAIDDALLDKSSDPHEIMEVYQWPMPLPDDAGRIRAAYPPYGQTHEFWETYDEYFKPVNEEAVKSMLADAPDENADDAFRIPRLGIHWSESKGGGVTRDDPMSPDFGDDDTPLRAPGLKRKRPEPEVAGTEPLTPEQRLREQKLTMRILACFLQQDGVASAPETAGNSDSLEAMQAVSAASQQDGPGSQQVLAMKIEKRLRVELTNLGLMERADMEYDLEHLREDDVICAQLRLNQEALRKHLKEGEQAQTGSRKRLRMCIENGFQKEKLLGDVLGAAKGLTDCIAPKFKYAKGVKPHDVKKAIETWDRTYGKFKAHMANPSKRKPGIGGSAGKKLSGMKSGGGAGARPGVGGMWAGAAGGTESNAKSVASFHQSLHRK